MKQIRIIAALLCMTMAASAQETPKTDIPQTQPVNPSPEKTPADIPKTLPPSTPEQKPAATPEIKSDVAAVVKLTPNTSILGDKDRVTMFGDQLYLTRDGKAELVTNELALDDGTVIMSNGTIKTSSGKTIKLKNGQHYPGSQGKKKS